MGFLEKLQSKLEIYRLEKRYTRNRHRRSTFVSNAMYVDGEYVFQTPSTTGSSTNSNASASTSTEDHARRNGDMPTVSEYPEQNQTPAPPQKRLHRFSSIPKFNTGTFRSER
ncbi:hypothetical protein GGS20DRAFT_482781 [Poronia punctata]|nr:hypothetical protein GGS20DRAFT_482781 [Poronia punctata]